MSPGEDKPLTIHGKMHDMIGKVTALDCILVRARSDLFDVYNQEPGEYLVRPQRVLFGDYISGTSQTFTGIRLRTSDLDAWVRLSGFSWIRGKSGYQHIEYNPPWCDSVGLANGATLTFYEDVRMVRSSVRGGSIERDTWLEVSQLLPSSWQEIDAQIVTPLCSLIALCLGEVNKPTRVQLTVDGGNWLELCMDRIAPCLPSQDIEPLALFRQLQLVGVADWLDKVDDLGPLPPVVAHLSSRQSSMKLETGILELTTVLEGLHARLFSEEQRFDEKTLKDIKKRVLDAVDDMDSAVANVLGGLMVNLREPSYSRRLARLAETVSLITPGICGKVNKWVAEVSKIRNKYAHRTAGFIKEGDIDAQVVVLESLRWLLRCVLLLEAGIQPEALARQLDRTSGFHLL